MALYPETPELSPYSQENLQNNGAIKMPIPASIGSLKMLAEHGAKGLGMGFGGFPWDAEGRAQIAQAEQNWPGLGQIAEYAGAAASPVSRFAGGLIGRGMEDLAFLNPNAIPGVAKGAIPGLVSGGAGPKIPEPPGNVTKLPNLMKDLDEPVMAAFKLPDGRIVKTGAVHDISGLPAPFNENPAGAISGFANRDKFWPKGQGGMIDPNAFEPIPPVEGTKVVGSLSNIGGLHFPQGMVQGDELGLISQNSKFFPRPGGISIPDMPTSGLPDEVPDDIWERLASHQPVQFNSGGWGHEYKYPEFANESLPPVPPTPIKPKK